MRANNGWMKSGNFVHHCAALTYVAHVTTIWVMKRNVIFTQ